MTNLKKAYKTIVADHFPDKMTIAFGEQELVYKKRTWKIEEDHPLVRSGVATFTALFNGEPNVDKWTFSTNGVAICGKHGIPTIGFGPGNEIYAHAPNERTPIEHLEKAAAFYALLPHILEEQT